MNLLAHSFGLTVIVSLLSHSLNAQSSSLSNSDVSKEPSCSGGTKTGDPFNITIHNQTPFLISLYWVDNKCTPVFYYNIPQQNMSRQPTWTNFSWVAADNNTGRIVDRFKPLNSNGIDWIINVDASQPPISASSSNATGASQKQVDPVVVPTNPAVTGPGRGSSMLGSEAASLKQQNQNGATSPNASSSGASSSVIIGTVFGAIVGVVAIAGFTVFVMRQRNQRNTIRDSNPFVMRNRAPTSPVGMITPMTMSASSPRSPKLPSPEKLEPFSFNTIPSLNRLSLGFNPTGSNSSLSSAGLVISRNTQGFFDPTYRPRVRSSSSRLSAADLDQIAQDQLPSSAKRASDDGSFVVGKYCAIYHEYHAMVEDELTVFVKDQVQVNALFDDGWALVTHASEGIRGMIPQVCMMKELPPCSV